MRRHSEWVIVVFLLCVLLTACAGGMEETVTALEETAAVETMETAVETAAAETVSYEGMTEEEIAEAQCRAVLDTLQGGENYHIRASIEITGTIHSTMQIDNWRLGKERMQDNVFDKSSGLNRAVYLSRDGYVYCGYGGGSEWEKYSEESGWWSPDSDPWMYTFDWDAQKVEFLHKRKTAEGYGICWKVYAPYDFDYALAENYTIEFFFDEDGDFLERELTASGEQKGTGETYTRVDHVEIISVDAEEIRADMERQYQAAVAYLEGNPLG